MSSHQRDELGVERDCEEDSGMAWRRFCAAAFTVKGDCHMSLKRTRGIE